MYDLFESPITRGKKKKPDVLNAYWLEWGLQANVLSISHYTGVEKKEIRFSVAIKSPVSLTDKFILSFLKM